MLKNSQIEFHNNKKLFRFEMKTPQGEPAWLEYRWKKGDMLLMRTFVPELYRKQGVGTALVKKVLEYAREQKLEVQVYCPFINYYLNRKPGEDQSPMP